MNDNLPLENVGKTQEPDGRIRVRISARHDHQEAERCCMAFNAWASDKPTAAVIRTGSMGYDDLEPLVLIEKPGVPPILYAGITADKAVRLADSWLDGHDPLANLALGVLSEGPFQGIPPLNTLPLFKLQRRVALRRCGLISAQDIGQYRMAFAGYGGLCSALRRTPTEVLKHIGRAGLHERDGIGSPVYSRWNAFRELREDDKTLVCRAPDNDIQAHTARLLLESDPHGVLEGLVIAAYAVGASEAIITCPAGEGNIRRLLDIALGDMRKSNYLGENIVESGFNLNIEIKEVPRSLISCENSALLGFLAGKQASPSLPMKNSTHDMIGLIPALVTGVETLANIAPILQEGWSTAQDADSTRGIKILTLAGYVRHAYTIEVPYGTSIGAVIRDIGGAGDIKALQFGGPSSIYFGPDAFDKPISYATAEEAGADFGLSLLNVISEGACAVETVGSLMHFLHRQSCGKCVFCREGTLHLASMLDDIAGGTGAQDDLGLMAALGERMRTNCICAFGRTASNPVLSSVALFKPEYEHHIKQKKCPVGGRAGGGDHYDR